MMMETEHPLAPDVAGKMVDLGSHINRAAIVIGRDDQWAGELLRRVAQAVAAHICARPISISRRLGDEGRLDEKASGFKPSDRLISSLNQQRETFVIGDEILLPARRPPDRRIVRDKPSWLGQICSLIGHCAHSIARKLFPNRRVVRG